MALSVTRKFSDVEKNEAVEFVKRECPAEFSLLKRLELSGETIEFDDREAMFAAMFAALKNGGFSKSMIEGTTLVFSVRVAARREVGLGG